MNRFYDPLTVWDEHPARDVCNCILTAIFMPVKLLKLQAWERTVGFTLPIIYAYTQELAPYTKVDFYLVDKSCREAVSNWYTDLVMKCDSRDPVLHQSYSTWVRDIYTQRPSPIVAVPRVVETP